MYQGLRLLLVLGVGIALLAACSEEAEPTLTSSVMIDIYSGLPNPVMDLAAEELSAVQDIVAELPEQDSGLSVEPGGLGFRGFVIVPFSNQGTAYELTVLEESVILTPLDEGGLTAERLHLVDSERRLYGLLRGMVEVQHPDLASAIPPVTNP